MTSVSTASFCASFEAATTLHAAEGTDISEYPDLTVHQGWAVGAVRLGSLNSYSAWTLAGRTPPCRSRAKLDVLSREPRDLPTVKPGGVH